MVVFKNKKFLYLIYCVSIILIAVAAGAYFTDYQLTVKNFYYQTINPKAGAIKLEKEYKDNFDKADIARNAINFTIDEMQQKGQKELNPNDTQKTVDFYTYYDGQLNDQFSNRDTYFQEMLRIDGEANKLNLPAQYKEFYNKRQKADKNDYEAFKAYRKGMSELMNGSIVYYTYSDLYGVVLTKLLPKGNDIYSEQNNTAMLAAKDNFDTEFNKVQVLKDQGIYNNGVYNSLATSHMRVDLFRQLYEAYRSNDKKTIDTVSNKITQTNNQVNTQDQDIKVFLEWSKEKIQPYFFSQDSKHKASGDLYNQAYIYAKNENLTDILKIWGNSTPGTTGNNNKAI